MRVPLGHLNTSANGGNCDNVPMTRNLEGGCCVCVCVCVCLWVCICVCVCVCICYRCMLSYQRLLFGPHSKRDYSIDVRTYRYETTQQDFDIRTHACVFQPSANVLYKHNTYRHTRTLHTLSSAQ
jgi:hypothetical protein